MKNTLFGRLTKLQGRIQKYLKKSRELKRFGLMAVTVLITIPVLSVSAAESNSASENPIVVDVTVGETLRSEQPSFSVEIRPSTRQIAVRQAEVKRAVAKATVITATESEKREWVQRAALQWGIDWKILEAVWQVESGRQFYTAVRSHAGAQGPLQFMPGTWRGYAQDGNGDGAKDVLDARDSLFAAAKLLAVNGAASGNIDGALLRYNHSLSYVAKVKRIAASIGG